MFIKLGRAVILLEFYAIYSQGKLYYTGSVLYCKRMQMFYEVLRIELVRKTCLCLKDPLMPILFQNEQNILSGYLTSNKSLNNFGFPWALG